MKRTPLCLFCFFAAVSLLPNGYVQEDTLSKLPEGAKARLGKGEMRDVIFSPDGTRLDESD